MQSIIRHIFNVMKETDKSKEEPSDDIVSTQTKKGQSDVKVVEENVTKEDFFQSCPVYTSFLFGF